MSRRLLITVASIAMAALAIAPFTHPVSAVADPASTQSTPTSAMTEFTMPSVLEYSQPYPDSNGNVWCLETNGLAKVDRTGHITQYSDTTGHQTAPYFALDSAGNPWTEDTSGDSVFVSELDSAGHMHDYPVASYGRLKAGMDGTMWWIGDTTGITRITAAGEVTNFAQTATEDTVTSDGTFWFVGGSDLQWIAPGQTPDVQNEIVLPDVDGGANTSMIPGQDGSVWFAMGSGVGEITASHAVTFVTMDEENPSHLILRPDGSVWFLTALSDGLGGSGPGEVNRISATGQLTTYDLGLNANHVSLSDLVPGPDGNLWTFASWWSGFATPLAFAEDIASITPAGAVTLFPQPEGANTIDFMPGPNNTLWFENQVLTYGRQYYPTTMGPVSSGGNPVTLATTGWATSPIVFDTAGDGWVYDTFAQTLDEIWPTTSARLAGTDRYGTAIQISQQEFPGTAPIVYVASGENYPDALSAGPAAAEQRGPLLLTPATSLPPEVSAEIERLSPKAIVVVGGTGAVSDTVLDALNALAPTTRISGADRYASSRAVVNSAFASASTVYLATGANFPDALSAGAAAGSQQFPLLLVNGSETSLDEPTASLLRRLGVRHIDVIGGAGAISDDLAAALESIAPVKRLAGIDRYSTAEAVNEDAYQGGSSVDNVILATGTNFPDALSATAWAAATKAPLFLTQSSCVPNEVLADITDFSSPQVTLVGGAGVLSNDVQQLANCGTS